MRTAVAVIALSSTVYVQAAPPRNVESLDQLITRGCGFVNLAFVGRVSNLRTEPPERDKAYPDHPRGERQTADVTVMELIKGTPERVPRTLSGYKKIPMMTDQMGVDLEDNKSNLILMDWEGAPGRELVRFAELNYDSQLDKITDTAFNDAVRVARRACRP